MQPRYGLVFADGVRTKNLTGPTPCDIFVEDNCLWVVALETLNLNARPRRVLASFPLSLLLDSEENPLQVITLNEHSLVLHRKSDAGKDGLLLLFDDSERLAAFSRAIVAFRDAQNAADPSSDARASPISLRPSFRSMPTSSPVSPTSRKSMSRLASNASIKHGRSENTDAATARASTTPKRKVMPSEIVTPKSTPASHRRPKRFDDGRPAETRSSLSREERPESHPPLTSPSPMPSSISGKTPLSHHLLHHHSPLRVDTNLFDEGIRSGSRRTGSSYTDAYYSRASQVQQHLDSLSQAAMQRDMIVEDLFEKRDRTRGLHIIKAELREEDAKARATRPALSAAATSIQKQNGEQALRALARLQHGGKDLKFGVSQNEREDLLSQLKDMLQTYDNDPLRNEMAMADAKFLSSKRRDDIVDHEKTSPSPPDDMLGRIQQLLQSEYASFERMKFDELDEGDASGGVPGSGPSTTTLSHIQKLPEERQVASPELLHAMTTEAKLIASIRMTPSVTSPYGALAATESFNTTEKQQERTKHHNLVATETREEKTPVPAAAIMTTSFEATTPKVSYPTQQQQPEPPTPSSPRPPVVATTNQATTPAHSTGTSDKHATVTKLVDILESPASPSAHASPSALSSQQASLSQPGPNWQAKLDAASGKYYYIHSQTKKTTWKLADTLAPAPSGEEETNKAAHSVPSVVTKSSPTVSALGWLAKADAATGKTYFVNASLKKTTWNIQETDLGSSSPVAAAVPSSPTSAASNLAASDEPGPGWTAKLDPASGKTFYVHKDTKKTTWKVSETRGGSIAQPSSTPSLANNTVSAAGWSAKVDTATGKTYYVNTALKKTTWNVAETDLAGVAKNEPEKRMDAASGTPGPNWVPKVDPGSGKTYFVHKETKKTTWKLADTLV